MSSHNEFGAKTDAKEVFAAFPEGMKGKVGKQTATRNTPLASN